MPDNDVTNSRAAEPADRQEPTSEQRGNFRSESPHVIEAGKKGGKRVKYPMSNDTDDS